MKVIYKAPGKPAELREIENSLEALQAAVEGYIETVTIGRDCCLICNEEGLLRGMPYNCHFLGSPFVGPILVVGVAGEEFCDVPCPETWLAAMDTKK